MHVPYKGSGPALSDAVGGQIEILFDNLPSSMPQIQAKALKPMAVAWPTRIKSMPERADLRRGRLSVREPAGVVWPAGARRYAHGTS